MLAGALSMVCVECGYGVDIAWATRVHACAPLTPNRTQRSLVMKTPAAAGTAVQGYGYCRQLLLHRAGAVGRVE